MFRHRRSLFFKKMQIVRGCDVKRNVLVYMVYSDRIIEGSPKNSTSLGADHAVGRERFVAAMRRLRREVATRGLRLRNAVSDASIRSRPDAARRHARTVFLAPGQEITNAISWPPARRCRA